MSLPQTLIDKIKRGRVVLFLGSGALIGAKLKKYDVPKGNDLGIYISDRFLNGDYKYESLTQIADLAISEHGIIDVQEFIREIFEDLEVNDFHKIIPDFQWKAIFSTNYDRMIEFCYETKKTNQTLSIHLSNNDGFNEGEKTTDILNFIKLHGCITRTRDPELPLILTVEQFNDYEKNRNLLFKYLYELAIEYSIVFVGHSLQDANIRHIISMVNNNVPQGQRHYLLKPGIKDPEINLWASKKINALNFTFEAFLREVNDVIPWSERFNYLITPVQNNAIQKIFVTTAPPSEELNRILTGSIQYVHSDMNTEQFNPKEFYKGSDLGWYAQSAELAIKRSLLDRFLEEVILKPETERSDTAELILLKGEAGSGKTVFLRQVAWEMRVMDFGCPLWVNNGDNLTVEIIKEVIEKTNERVFLYWDDASLHVNKIAAFMNNAIKAELKITIITAERYNEWSQRCDSLKELITEVYSLHNLSESEVTNLVEKLEFHDCLGPNLINKNKAERIQEFIVNSERQLLVALHEATMGEPFEDIIFSEYESIYPIQARTIYRTICTLNRLRVPVRAGLIARIFGINFTEFKQQFFTPLEKIVLWDSEGNDDYHYRARHSEIAEIVFNRAFSNTLEKYNEYTQILDKINIAFESDRISFRQFMRAKSLNEIFPDYQDVISIYQQALKTIGEDPYLLQQMANFERIRPNGNLTLAIELLENAKEKAPYDSSIIHTMATVWRDKANNSNEAYDRIKFRGEARHLLQEAQRRWGGSSYISTTLLELSIDNFEDNIKDDNVSGKIIDDLIRRIEEEITISKQTYPDEAMLSNLEARFAGIMSDDGRILSSLLAAFSDNSRDPFIAIRLSKIYIDKGDFNEASKVLTQALERRRNDHRLNYQYAELLRSMDPSKRAPLIYYYRRAFTPSDKNFHAQFWFARFAYESSDPKELALSADIFEYLRTSRVSKDDRFKIRDYIGGEINPTIFRGSLKGINSGFGFVTVDGSGKDIFFPRSEVQHDLWEALKVGDRLKFNIGFNYAGAVACNIVPS
ncbi:SIR2 family protein [Klebsiella pneumoniae]|uniref:P-loop NTPase n=1 Tax=Klebsiella pneumoniae TaxID=573 RepID=UPI0003422228|nr:SIR2 family protein [Klebsiella pneumoniae]EOY63539.1 SIR2-like domain protein [Klebsiella pneumoniae KP-7]EOZ71780.1 SIR2-like domain protein [Klebsiella pneumoniae KP-11]MBG1842789.1 SIR2 family protein [Klebsiella pneumoniae]HBQ6671712.1 SIR2 family protein [Klebsiella pneumoniae]HBT8461393.1 cold shock domain-containing protein [Klebsiella pneumoniae]